MKISSNICTKRKEALPKSIKLKVSLLIFMALEKLNWLQVEFMFTRRLDWINATYTALGKANLDHTTLFKFYQQLEEDPAAYQLFVDLSSHHHVCPLQSQIYLRDGYEENRRGAKEGVLEDGITLSDPWARGRSARLVQRVRIPPGNFRSDR